MLQAQLRAPEGRKAATARAVQVETGRFRCKREAFLARGYRVDPAL
jgi:hypothetical protein